MPEEQQSKPEFFLGYADGLIIQPEFFCLCIKDIQAEFVALSHHLRHVKSLFQYMHPRHKIHPP